MGGFILPQGNQIERKKSRCFGIVAGMNSRQWSERKTLSQREGKSDLPLGGKGARHVIGAGPVGNRKHATAGGNRR